MDTSSSYTVDNTELQTLILNETSKEVFELVIESLESNIDREFFDKILEFLMKNQKMKTSCYVNKTCLSIPREDQIKKHTDDGSK